MTADHLNTESSEPSRSSHLARLVLVAFLLTFICARCIVFLIMSRTIPDLYMHVKGTHVHHLNYGILLLSGLGGYLLFKHPVGRKRHYNRVTLRPQKGRCKALAPAVDILAGIGAMLFAVQKGA